MIKEKEVGELVLWVRQIFITRKDLHIPEDLGKGTQVSSARCPIAWCN